MFWKMLEKATGRVSSAMYRKGIGERIARQIELVSWWAFDHCEGSF